MNQFYSYTLYFAFYSVLGWVIESTFCSIKFHKFINRGFLNGPLCPIYAAGALSVVIFMQWLPKIGLALSIFLVFLLGLILTSLVEYLTGWLLELLFKSKWWDYSDTKYNIKGRVCLQNSFAFGFMCVILIFIVHPAVIGTVGMLPPLLLKWLSLVFITVTACDLVITVFTVQELNQRLNKIQTGMQAIKEKLDSFQWYTASSSIKERLTQLYDNRDTENQLFKSIDFINEHIKQIQLDNRALQRRILNAFPNIKSLRYPEHLNDIKEQIGILIKKKS